VAPLIAVPDPMTDDGTALLVSIPAERTIQDVTAAAIKAGAKVESSALVGSHAARYTVPAKKPK
jgi:hypothetical protein